ncbi:MAG TPA: response regulator, partial [Gaiellaceae bacterium]|nr:response regulator [Gaiellaceae bacterium]
MRWLPGPVAPHGAAEATARGANVLDLADAQATEDFRSAARTSTITEMAILVVDDDQAVRDALRRELGQRCALTVSDGVEQAVQLLEGDQEWDIVLCDLMMPGGGGEALFESVSARWPQLSKRVVFITGGASDERA